MIIKKKLKDISLEEFKVWSIKNCKQLSCEKCVFSKVCCDEFSSDCWINNKDIYSDKFLNQEIEIEIKDVLDEKEKEYLKSIIIPFKDRVEYIEKKKNINSEGTFYFIAIAIKSVVIDCLSETIYFPYFKPESKMYEGMELNKEYTLKELGL
jgi:hypothetical protein